MKWIFLFATLMSLPFAAPEMLRIDYATLSGKYLAEVGYLIIFATFIAYYLIPVSQKLIRPTLVSMYSYVQPIIAIVITNAPLIGRGQSPSTSSSAPSHLQTLVHLLYLILVSKSGIGASRLLVVLITPSS